MPKSIPIAFFLLVACIVASGGCGPAYVSGSIRASGCWVNGIWYDYCPGVIYYGPGIRHYPPGYYPPHYPPGYRRPPMHHPPGYRPMPPPPPPRHAPPPAIRRAPPTPPPPPHAHLPYRHNGSHEMPSRSLR